MTMTRVFLRPALAASAQRDDRHQHQYEKDSLSRQAIR
jgi:hypothetical protein